jgi:hypothetical protein
MLVVAVDERAVDIEQDCLDGHASSANNAQVAA